MRVYSKRRRFWLLTLGAIDLHLDAQITELPLSIIDHLRLEDAA
jgi:hypothetical protein